MNADIKTYNNKQSSDSKAICERLAVIINDVLPEDESKVWHGAPVWFLDGNPIAGYAVRKANVQLLFWSGQSFDEPGLETEGKFKAAQARYTSAADINEADLRRWLKKGREIQWDYKNIVKNKGKLNRIK